MLRAFVSVLLALTLTLWLVPPSISLSSVSYDFDSADQLSAEFDSYVGSGSISQSSTGGIGNSGAINAPSSANAVFASKDQYSLGAEGSVYTFTSYLKSVFNNGYSGMGFTSLTPSSANASGTPFRPNDALGISVHGGGFVFHNGGTDYNGSWGSDNPGITSVKKSSIGDLLNSGSPDDWYKVDVIVTRTAGDTFKLRVEIWSSDSSGNLLRPAEADAIFEKSSLTNSTILNAPAISSYINFSGSRVEYFDDYQVNLQGSSVIAAGAPVVLTGSTSETSGVISVTGSVSSDGGASITERGFVLGTSASPTIADTKLSVAGTTGSMSADSSSLGAGTYYIRAFATNATGTSYGEEKTVTIAGPPSYAVSFDVNGGTGSMPNQTSTSSQSLTTNSFVRDGFNFSGWNTEADGSGTSYADGATYSFSASVTLYAQWQEASSTPIPYAGPIITDVGDDGRAGAFSVSQNETTTVAGKRLSAVTKAIVDGKEAEIIEVSDSKLEIVVPEGLAPGTYDLYIQSSIGNLTYLDALVITASVGTTCSGESMSYWTTRISDTQAKVYIKCPQLDAKIRILHQTGGSGEYDVPFVKTITSVDDSSLVVNSFGTYIVRTIELEEINRIRISIDDQEVWKVRYNR